MADVLDYRMIRALEVEVYGDWFEMGGYPCDGPEFDRMYAVKAEQWAQYLKTGLIRGRPVR